MCTCVQMSVEARRGHGSPGAGVMGSCGPPDMGAVEPNSNPLQNQHLATEKSLQPLYFPFLPLGKRSGRQHGILYPFLVFKYSQQLEGAMWRRREWLPSVLGVYRL